MQKLRLAACFAGSPHVLFKQISFWIGCFAICSFRAMTEIYSDFRGLIWRNSTVGGQTLSGMEPLCCSVPSDFLFFPAEHTLNSACFGIGCKKKKKPKKPCAFLSFIVIKPQSLASQKIPEEMDNAASGQSVGFLLTGLWCGSACAVMVKGKKGCSEGRTGKS